MQKKDTFSKILTLVGTILVWLPILAPFILGFIILFMDGTFLFDYLMPAEFSTIVFAGCGLLLWAAIRTKAWQKIIFWGVGLASASIVALMLMGGVQQGTFQYYLVMTLLALYWLAAIAVGCGGLLLWRDLFKKYIPAPVVE